MSRAVHLTTAARLDIERLHDWLFEENPNAALRLITTLQKHFESLSKFAERGRPIEEDVRELIARFGGSTYVIRYEVGADNVLISRIWHSLEHR